MPACLIGVMTCWKNPKHSIVMPDRVLVDHMTRVSAIRQTWATAETKYFYGSRESHSPTASDEIILACGDSYYETSFKIREMCRWALNHGYKSLFKTDDDTYLRPERMDFTSDFVCRVLPPTDENHPVPYPYGGCGYYLGERMLTAAAEDKHCTSDPNGDTWGRCNTYEDGWIGRVALDAGIKLTDDHRLKLLRYASGDIEGYPWRAEAPAHGNNMISVCEFPNEKMYEVHSHFEESWTGETRKFS
jgi:hypothetical protein